MISLLLILWDCVTAPIIILINHHHPTNYLYLINHHLTNNHYLTKNSFLMNHLTPQSRRWVVGCHGGSTSNQSTPLCPQQHTLCEEMLYPVHILTSLFQNFLCLPPFRPLLNVTGWLPWGMCHDILHVQTMQAFIVTELTTSLPYTTYTQCLNAIKILHPLLQVASRQNCKEWRKVNRTYIPMELNSTAIKQFRLISLQNV